MNLPVHAISGQIWRPEEQKFYTVCMRITERIERLGFQAEFVCMKYIQAVTWMHIHKNTKEETNCWKMDAWQSTAPILIRFQAASLYALTALPQFICLLEYLVLFEAIQMV